MKTDQKPHYRFSLGRVVYSSGALETLPVNEIEEALSRHHCADWGNVCPVDWMANEAAVDNGTRLLSSFKTAEGKTFWIITEADRSQTTVLLPTEY